MKKLIFSLAAILIALNTFAHDTTKVKRTPESSANMRADKLKAELGLSDVQRNQVYAAVLEKMNQAKAIKQKYKDSANKKSQHSEMKLVKQSFDAKMNSILTPEQKVKYEALKAGKKDNMKAKKGKMKKGQTEPHDDEDDD
jgi:Spy/CpxP family protein refolding chaperone